MMNQLYTILMIDPPWPKKRGGIRKIRPNQSRDFDYLTLSVLDIFKLLDERIFPSAITHCVFMWCIDEFLIECERQMQERNYKRHCRFIWNKDNGVAPAFTIRFAHEYLIWYYKTKLMPIATACRGKFKTLFTERSRQHSRKPDFAYRMIEMLYPDQPKIDVFSREYRANWDQFGNQLDHFKTVTL